MTRTAVDRYRVVGHPIAHSRSPEIHRAFALQTGQPLVYDRALIPLAPPEAFDDAIRAFAAEGGRGVNVTLPFKARAFALATRHSDRARVAGACNTLILGPDGIAGDNTDGPGLVADVQGRLGFGLAGRRVTVLGAGGAARGLMLSLLQAGVASLTVANRSLDRVGALVEHVERQRPDPDAGAVRIGIASLEQAPAADLVINATSAGLLDEPLPLPPDLFRSCGLAYDCVYAAAPTAFMTQARTGGSRAVSDGLGMLVEQAAESFMLWRGVRPRTAPVLAALRESLTAASAR